MEKLLVVGVETLAGANIALQLADRLEVVGLSSQPQLILEGVTTEFSRPADSDRVAEVAAEFQPDWIVECGMLSASSWDLPADASHAAAEPGLAAQFAAQLAEIGKQQHARLTVVATDAVCGGPRMFHDETTPVCAAHPAAEHALRLEQTLCAAGALVVRTHVYGWSPAGADTSTVEQIWQALSTGAALPADGCRYATPILATDLAELLHRACECRLQGLFHLSGAERTSPYRLAGELAAAAGLAGPRTRCATLAMSSSESGTSTADTPARWPLNETSLNCRRARRALETPLPLLREGLARFAEQAANGWLERTRLADHAATLPSRAA